MDHANLSVAGRTSEIFWRHKLLAVTVFAVVFSGVIAYTAVTDRRFTSEARLYVRIGRETVNLDPTATTGQVVNVSDARANEIHSVADLLESRSLISQVLEKHDASERAAKPGLMRHVTDRFRVLEPVNLDPFKVYSLRDEAIHEFSKNLSVTYSKRSSVISISLESDAPESARDMLASLIETAQDEHIRVNRTEGSLQFFEDQLGQQQARLAQLESELREFKTKTGIADLPTQRQIHLTRLGRLIDQQGTIAADISAAEAEVASRRQTIASLPELILSEEVDGQSNTANDGMREQLYALQLREKELASIYQDKEPKLVQVRAQIADAQSQLAKEESTTRVSRSRNPAYDAVQLALHARDAELASLSVKNTKLKEQVAEAKREIDSLNKNEVLLAQFERDLELARANYRNYGENLEQARIDHALELQKISNINLLQPPTLVETPTSPDVLLNALLAVVLGCFVSVGAVALMHQPAARSAEGMMQSLEAEHAQARFSELERNGNGHVPQREPATTDSPRNPR